MQLPHNIRAKVDEMAAQFPAKTLSAAADLVSSRYRRIDSRTSSFALTSKAEAFAYAAVRLPATYAAAKRVFDLIQNEVPLFTPQSISDYGAGPGTVTLAAEATWNSLKSCTLIEPNTHLRTVGQRLLDQSYHEWIAGEIKDHISGQTQSDLVTAGYVLNEIDQKNLADYVTSLWNKTKSMLVIIEPGTPTGQDVILKARDTLIAANAHIIAPCPHAMDCPIAKNFQSDQKWCHFEARAERSKTQIMLKSGARMGYEDEKFSFIAASRLPQEKKSYARIIGHPRGQKVIEAEICKQDGLIGRIKSAKSSPDHKRMKKARWGDNLVEKLPASTNDEYE